MRLLGQKMRIVDVPDDGLYNAILYNAILLQVGVACKVNKNAHPHSFSLDNVLRNNGFSLCDLTAFCS